MMEPLGGDVRIGKMVKWIFNHSHCNGSAVVSPFPLYQADRASDTSSRPSRGAEKVLGLLGPETPAQRRQIHAILEKSMVTSSDSDDDDDNDDGSFEFETTQRRGLPQATHFRIERPPRLDLRPRTRTKTKSRFHNRESHRLEPPARDIFQFPTPPEAHNPPHRSRRPSPLRPSDAQGFPLPPWSPDVFYSPTSTTSSAQYYFESVQQSYRNSPCGSTYATPTGSPRQPSPRGVPGFHPEPQSPQSFNRAQPSIFSYPEPQSPHSSRQPAFVSAPQSPYAPHSRSFIPPCYNYHVYCPSRLQSSSPEVEVELNEKLGSGSYGIVYRGTYSKTGTQVAVKTPHGDEKYAKEFSVLKRLDNPHIIKCYGTTTLSDGRFAIILELMKCSVDSLIRSEGLKDGLKEPLIREYTRQILYGLEYLHGKNIVHRDIKCANILLDFKGVAKLGDLGLAKEMDYSCAKSCKGTVFYMAPEILINNGQEYGLAADIWSLGCTVIEMAEGKHPWKNHGILQIYESLLSGQCPPIPPHLSAEGRDFVKKCFTRQPDRRPAASTLLRHAFVRAF